VFDSTGSYIKASVERMRFLLNSSISDRFTDDYVVRNVFAEAFAQVMNSVSMSNDNPVVMKYDFTITPTVTRYTLPPTIQEVWWVGVYDTNGHLTSVIKDIGNMAAYPFNSSGGWRLDGNQILFEPAPSSDLEVKVVGTINGSIAPHYSTGGRRDSATEITLDLTPDLGLLDKRANAYAGQYIRVLSDDAIEERVIESYDAATAVATLRSPLTDDTEETITYEVGPPSFPGLTQALGCKMALMFSSNLELAAMQVRRLEVLYEQAIKVILDNTSHLNIARGKAIDLDTVLGVN
jgi:hypothetical protein